jgi:hypothetical protein
MSRQWTVTDLQLLWHLAISLFLQPSASSSFEHFAAACDSQLQSAKLRTQLRLETYPLLQTGVTVEEQVLRVLHLLLHLLVNLALQLSCFSGDSLPHTLAARCAHLQSACLHFLTSLNPLGTLGFFLVHTERQLPLANLLLQLLIWWFLHLLDHLSLPAPHVFTAFDKHAERDGALQILVSCCPAGHPQDEHSTLHLPFSHLRNSTCPGSQRVRRWQSVLQLLHSLRQTAVSRLRQAAFLSPLPHLLTAFLLQKQALLLQTTLFASPLAHPTNLHLNLHMVFALQALHSFSQFAVKSSLHLEAFPVLPYPHFCSARVLHAHLGFTFLHLLVRL